MHRPGKFVFQDVIDQPLAIHPAAIGECCRNDFHTKMGFAFGAGTDMAGMKVGFVHHLQGLRRECSAQLGFDIFCNGHGATTLQKAVVRLRDSACGGKRHVLAWANSGDHTAEMSKQDTRSGSALKEPTDDGTKHGMARDSGPETGAPGKIAICDHPDCAENGEFRAPRSRTELTNFYWFCLEHVREYNAAWNYYADMDDAAVEAEIRKDIVWQRPTWPLGTRPGANGPQFRDPLSLLGDGPMDPGAEREAQMQMQNLTAPEREALSVLGLVAPITKADVKHRYKLLAKSLHPDANGGDKRAEDRLKSVNHAYTTLRDSERLT